MMRVNRVLMLWALTVSAFLLAGFALPGVAFQSGDLISAATMNQKFEAIESALTALQDETTSNTDALAALPTQAGTVRGYFNYTPWAGAEEDKQRHWMSTTSEAPILTKHDVGSYTIKWPGEEYFIFDDCVQVTSTGEPAIFRLMNAPIGRTWIRITAPNGTPIDTPFSVLLLNDDLPEGHVR